MAPTTEFKVTRAGDVALVTIDNGEDWTKPTFFGEAALESLQRALDELERGDYSAALITGKPFFFHSVKPPSISTTFSSPICWATSAARAERHAPLQ